MMGHDGTWKSHMRAKYHYEVVVKHMPPMHPRAGLRRWFDIVRGIFVVA